MRTVHLPKSTCFCGHQVLLPVGEGPGTARFPVGGYYVFPDTPSFCDRMELCGHLLTEDDTGPFALMTADPTLSRNEYFQIIDKISSF